MSKFHLTSLLILLPIVAFSQIDLSNGVWLPTSHPREITVNCLASYEGLLLAGSGGGGLHTSRDGGLTWDRNYEQFPASVVTDFLVLDGEILASTNTKGVFSSKDGGASWRAINEGLKYTSGNCLASNGETIFLGTNSGVYKKSVSSEDWTYLPFPIDSTSGRGSYVSSLTLAGNQIIAGGSSVIYASRDSGERWIRIEDGFKSNMVSGIALPENIYVGTAGEGIFELNEEFTEVNLVREGPLSGFVGSTVNTIIFNDGTFLNLTGDRGILQDERTFNEGLTEYSVLDLVRHEDAYFVATASSGVYRMGVDNRLKEPPIEDQQIKILASDEIKVFPNPGSGEITIGLNLSEASKVEISLLTTQGQLVRQLVNEQTSTKGHWQRSVDLSDLSPGTYLLQLVAGQYQGSKLLVIQ